MNRTGSARGGLTCRAGDNKRELSIYIDEKLGRLEGMAIGYANLGLVAEQRGDIPGARELWTKSRDFNAQIGIKHMVEKVQGWLDSLPAE